MRHVSAVIPTIVLAVSLLSTGGRAEEIERNRPTSDPISQLCLHPWKGDFRKPEDANLAADEVYFTNASGHKLRGWLFEAEGAQKSILFCMGNAGNISLMLPYAKILQDAGFEVLLFDYQGFGNSEGAAGIHSLLSDSLAAFDFLVDSRGRKPQDIGIFGVSLGSVLALTVAAEKQAGAVAVEDAFIPNEQIDHLSKRFIRKDNTVAKFALASVKALLLGRVDPLRNVKRLKSPVFFLHGVNDRLLPPSGTLRIANACAGPKRVWLMEATGHAPESLEVNDHEYSSQLQSFFKDAFSDHFAEPLIQLHTQHNNRGFVATTVSITNLNSVNSTRFVSDNAEDSVPLQIAFADDLGNFQFDNRRLGNGTFSTKLNFLPVHAFAVRTHHAEDATGTHWKPKLSGYSNALSEFRATAHELFHSEEACEYFCSWEGFTFYNSRDSLPTFSQRQATLALNSLPAAKSLPERIKARYACLLARLHCWPKTSDAAQRELRYGEAMLQYLPDEPEDYYELGNARFQLKFRDSVVGDSLFRLAKARLTNGEANEARKLLRLHVSILPEHMPTNLSEERISSINTLDDLIGK